MRERDDGGTRIGHARATCFGKQANIFPRFYGISKNFSRFFKVLIVGKFSKHHLLKRSCRAEAFDKMPCRFCPLHDEHF